jgi:hypothetical protein
MAACCGPVEVCASIRMCPRTSFPWIGATKGNHWVTCLEQNQFGQVRPGTCDLVELCLLKLEAMGGTTEKWILGFKRHHAETLGTGKSFDMSESKLWGRLGNL